MKKSLIFLILIFILIPFVTKAEQLVFISAEKEKSVEDQLKDYNKSIFYEERFLLSHESDNWEVSSSNQEILSQWDDTKFYFVLYPIRDFDLENVMSFCTILKATPDFIIIETETEILNDINIFHSFKIVGIFNQHIKTITEVPLPISQETFVFNPVIQQMVDSVSVDSIWHYISTLQGMERYTTNSSAINSSNFLKNYFESLGFDSVYFHTWQSGSIPNVIAVKYGKLYPDEIYLVGGHYDVYSNGIREQMIMVRDRLQ